VVSNLKVLLYVSRLVLLFSTTFSIFIVMPWIFSWNSNEVFLALPLATIAYIMLLFIQIKWFFKGV
jgi:hypothetical protein